MVDRGRKSRRQRAEDETPQRAGGQRDRGPAAKPEYRAAPAHGALLIALVVVGAATLIAHWPALSAQAASFDDFEYLHNNALVRNPSWSSVGRFFSEVLHPSTVRGYYQPLAMTSLMVDYALGGRPEDFRVFHRTSLTLHVLNALLVTVLFYLLFDQPWVAAAAGLLFGVHPITAESVAWLAERKTLLASFFALLAMCGHVLYARGRAADAPRGGWRWFYAGSLVAYFLALLSKPTSVPLPVLLLALDFWPLRRLSWRAVWEKIPHFVLSGVAAVVTYISQAGEDQGAEVLGDASQGPAVLVVCHNVVFYLLKALWPSGLASIYPFPKPFGLAQPMVLLGLAGTLGLVVAAILLRRRWPALAAGLGFFVIALLPTLGFIRFTNEIAAIRFVYLPLVGLLLIPAALLSAVWRVSSQPPLGVAALVVVIAGVAGWTARDYLAQWQTSERLSRHMVQVVPASFMAHFNLGYALEQQQRYPEAIESYQRALTLRPDHIELLNNTGLLLARLGQTTEAIGYYQKAIKLDPESFESQLNLADVLALRGEYAAAVEHFRAGMKLRPDLWRAHMGLGTALMFTGALDESERELRTARALRPDDPGTLNNLGQSLAAQGKLDEAIEQYQAALRIEPLNVNATINLGVVYQRQGRLADAVALLRTAIGVDGKRNDARLALATTLRAQGQIEAAAATLREALQVNPNDGKARAALEALAREQGPPQP